MTKENYQNGGVNIDSLGTLDLSEMTVFVDGVNIVEMLNRENISLKKRNRKLRKENKRLKEENATLRKFLNQYQEEAEALKSYETYKVWLNNEYRKENEKLKQYLLNIAMIIEELEQQYDDIKDFTEIKEIKEILNGVDE